MKRGSVVALGVVVGVVAVLIWVLVTGGGGSGSVSSSANDEERDVELTNGPTPPKDVSFVDIRSSSVSVAGENVVFEVKLAGEIPNKLGKGNATWRWDIEEEATVTWIVQASVNVEKTASILATQVDFSGSSIAGDLPGEFTIEGDTVRIVLERDRLDDFPTSFSWALRSEVDGDLAVTESSLGSDRLPDDGSLEAAS